MPTFATSQEWLKQSQLLLDARPSTTRITTRYAISAAAGKPPKEGEGAAPTKPPRARLVLKTYDPVSGACLKYRTSKAAEVSRLVQMLGSLGRRMAALPARDDGLLDPAGAASADPATTPVAVAEEAAAAVPSPRPPQQQQQGGGGGGGKGKKKKGKR